MKPITPKRVARSNSILWNEAIGFSLMIALSWLTEVFRIPHLIYGEPFTPNWHRALIRTVAVLLVWAWVNRITRRLLKRLHHLEEFLRICSWCRKVGDNNRWLTMEEYFNSKFDTNTSHGMCPDCMAKAVQELDQNNQPSKTPPQ